MRTLFKSATGNTDSFARGASKVNPGDKTDKVIAYGNPTIHCLRYRGEEQRPRYAGKEGVT